MSEPFIIINYLAQNLMVGLQFHAGWTANKLISMEAITLTMIPRLLTSSRWHFVHPVICWCLYSAAVLY